MGKKSSLSKDRVVEPTPSKWLFTPLAYKWWRVTWLNHQPGKICEPSNWILSPLFRAENSQKILELPLPRWFLPLPGMILQGDARHRSRHLDQFFQYFRLQRNGSIGFTSLRSRPLLVFVGWQAKPW